MNDHRTLVAIFCDDVRAEMGNKLTLVGCYGPDLLLPHLPATLPKLGVYIRVYTPVDQPLSQLKLRMLLNSDVIGELDVKELSDTPPEGIRPPEANWLVVGAVLLVSPVNLNEPSEIRLEAETESGPLRPARLWIKTLPQAMQLSGLIRDDGPEPLQKLT